MPPIPRIHPEIKDKALKALTTIFNRRPTTSRNLFHIPADELDAGVNTLITDFRLGRGNILEDSPKHWIMEAYHKPVDFSPIELSEEAKRIRLNALNNIKTIQPKVKSDLPNWLQEHINWVYDPKNRRAEGWHPIDYPVDDRNDPQSTLKMLAFWRNLIKDHPDFEQQFKRAMQRSRLFSVGPMLNTMSPQQDDE